LGTCDANMAKLWGIWEGISMAKILDCGKLIIESDSLAMI